MLNNNIFQGFKCTVYIYKQEQIIPRAPGEGTNIRFCQIFQKKNNCMKLSLPSRSANDKIILINLTQFLLIMVTWSITNRCDVIKVFNITVIVLGLSQFIAEKTKFSITHLCCDMLKYPIIENILFTLFPPTQCTLIM